MSTSSSMSAASSPATAPASFWKSSCRRSAIGSRRSDPRVSASDALRQARAEIAVWRSKMDWPHLVEFVAARVAEAKQQIDRAIDGHFAQLDETFVRL